VSNPAAQMPAGPGIDAHGRSVDDPTANVVAILDAAVRRQDDLRQSESEHVQEILRLTSAHAKEIRLAETARIDAIRAVDVSAVAAAAQVSATQATTLAAQVAASADAMRTQVAAAATAATVGLTAALDPIQKAIDDLRRAQYEQQGQKQQVTESRGGSALLWQIVAAVVAFGAAGLTAVSIIIGVAFYVFKK
jgi:cobalamin biosynthesis Mg chelatase CobN